MNLFRTFVLATFIIACVELPCIALESKVFTISEKKISLDLGPNFEINSSDINPSTKGIFSQDMLINDTSKPGAAFLSVISVYDSVMKKLRPSVLSEIFLAGGISAAESAGAVEIGNWSATDSLGNNLTVHTLRAKDPRVKYQGGNYDVARWNLDKSTYAILVSLSDKNTTRQIIETLTIS